jgi:hypothetical protein
LWRAFCVGVTPWEKKKGVPEIVSLEEWAEGSYFRTSTVIRGPGLYKSSKRYPIPVLIIPLLADMFKS